LAKRPRSIEEMQLALEAECEALGLLKRPPKPSEFDKLMSRFGRPLRQPRRPPDGGGEAVPVGEDHPRPKPRPPGAAEAKLEFRDDEPDQN
jgi:hypothetical protein